MRPSLPPRRRAGKRGRGSIRAVLRTIARKALTRWRSCRLRAAYAAAWEEWDGSEDARLWESTVGDGLEDEGWPNAPRRNGEARP